MINIEKAARAASALVDGEASRVAWESRTNDPDDEAYREQWRALVRLVLEESGALQERP